MKWINKGHEFDHLKSFDFDKHKYIIWGAGTYGISFFMNIKDKLQIVKFIDRNKELQGEYVGSVPIISPEEFFENRNKEIVIVSTGLTRSVYSELEKRGFTRFVDYFHIDEIQLLYMFFKHGKVCVSDLPLGITQCCTLHCDHCNAFIPLISCPRNFPVEQVLNDLKCVMQWINEINVLGLVGGDAMVHPKFRDILTAIAEEYYPERIHNIEIYSNAVIVPDKEDITLFKKYNVYYRFTDYSGQSGKQNIDDVIDILKNENIKYDYAKLESWYDCGYPQESNGILTENGLREFCTACDRKTCHDVRNKRLFTCAMCINADYIGYCPIEETDYFELEPYDENRKAEFIEYYLGYSEKGYYSYCRMCNGGMNINTHKIVAGKQLYNIMDK